MNPTTESGSSVIREGGYSSLAVEYYDDRRHPTCADFRDAARSYIASSFSTKIANSNVADIGCGLSLLAEFRTKHLTLVDSSREMLALNSGQHSIRLKDVEKEAFGQDEFEWIFAVLGDPYNTLRAWDHIRTALVPDGTCVFIAPSFVWASKFRSADKNEQKDRAAFVTCAGKLLYVPSFIRPLDEQIDLIMEAGLAVQKTEPISIQNFASVRSSKIRNFLEVGEPLLDVYIATRP